MVDSNKNIEIPILARVEGEGALNLKIEKNQIARLNLKIYEPPRLFEKFLEGREPNEVVDAVARICGICPVAYQMSAVHAIEQVFDMDPGPWVREMRRLFYCGEWMESHGIHIHMLAAPDFLGYPSVIAMAKDHSELVKRGMRLHALGMDLMSLLGQRSINPVGACIGGFYRAPSKSQVKNLLDRFIENLPLARDLVQWSTTLDFPQVSQSFTSVSVSHPDEYPMNEGQIVSDMGLEIDRSEFESYFQESQVSYSTALHCKLNGADYLVGPLARVNLNYSKLPVEARELIESTSVSFPSSNMYHSIVARAVEIYYAMLEAIRIMQNYTVPEHSFIKMTPKAGIGFGCTEAPRGLLWQRYELDKSGLVKVSKIVPPTSQNQGRIENDIKFTLEQYGLEQSEEALRLLSEKVIRNYDPCISCSTHFLKLNVER